MVDDSMEEARIPHENMLDHCMFSQSYKSHELFEFSLGVRHNNMFMSGKVPIPNEQKFNKIRNPAVEIRYNNL